jgi:iron complex transport system permease protein
VSVAPVAAAGVVARRLTRPLALSTLALVLVVVLAAGIGTVRIGPADVMAATARGIEGTVRAALGLAPIVGVDAGQRVIDTIVWQIRLPRVALAALVGAALALAGAGFQGVFRNPLADPYLLGAASGAGFAAALVMVAGGTLGALGGVGVSAAAFVGATLTVLAVVALARRGWTLPVVPLVLAGVVIGSCLAAGTSFVLLAAREQAAGILTWLLGSLAFASWERVGSLLPLVLIAGAGMLAAARALDVLQLGELAAAHLGVSVEALKLGVVLAGTLATAAAVSVAGVIGFVGLVVPHAVRLAFGPDHRRLVPLAAVWGAGFMVLADLVARTVIAPAELPVGVVTALVGAPFFLLLLRRRSAA